MIESGSQPCEPVSAGASLTAAFTSIEDAQLIEEAEAAGVDLRAQAGPLRARFLARIAAAQRRAKRSLTLQDGDTSGGVRGEAGDIPTSLGRYQIIDRLGSGGMGVVYAAYDEMLGRNLAIKVLHEDAWDVNGRRRERLLREAQAMAKVSHPNLATVHEVGVTGGQLFVAMEFISGPTLERWLVTQSRSWREVAAVFQQIAEGLAAMHQAGLLHRDVKPANVIVGDAGWVKVLDLGLVAVDEAEFAETAESLSAWSSSLSQVDQLLTRTGDRLGTPAYMSPEQFLGRQLTPASDIFSLCVALYEALHGVHPFIAEGLEELRENVLECRIAPPQGPSQVPGWLHELVLQGLSSKPARRPKSMRAIAEALARDRAVSRRRWIGGASLLGAAALLGIFGVRAQSSAPHSCEAGDAVIAEVWDEARSTEVREALLDTGLAYAGPMAKRLVAGLDDYAGSWARAHRDVCLDHADGRHSSALLDARMACLDRRRQILGTTVELLAKADLGIAEHAGELVAKLPSIEACDDLSSLSVRAYMTEPVEAPSPAAPTDPKTLAVARGLSAELERCAILARGGRTDEAIERAQAVASTAESLDLPEELAQALLAQARIEMDRRGDPARIDRLLARALTTATSESLDGLAAEAMIRRFYMRGLAKGGSTAALEDARVAEAQLARAGGDTKLRALLLNNLGSVYLAAGDRDAAREAFEDSLDLKESQHGEDHLELAATLANLSLLAEDTAESERLQSRLIDIYRRHLGPDHPRTLDARLFQALTIADPQLSAQQLSELCPRFEVNGAPSFAVECEYELGRREFARGELPAARRAFALAEDGLPGEDERRPLAALYQQIGSGAELGLEGLLGAAEPQLPPASDWWARMQRAELRLVRASVLLEGGHPGPAADLLQGGLDDLEQIAGQAPPTEHERSLALTRATLGHALRASGSNDHAQIHALERGAEQYFLRWPQAYALRLLDLRTP